VAKGITATVTAIQLDKAAGHRGPNVVPMDIPDQSLVLQLLTEEIRRSVAEAIEHQDCVQSGPLAHSIANTYPNSGLSPDEISAEIARAASRAGLAVELTRPRQIRR
jgi:hypothetical protein